MLDASPSFHFAGTCGQARSTSNCGSVRLAGTSAPRAKATKPSNKKSATPDLQACIECPPSTLLFVICRYLTPTGIPDKRRTGRPPTYYVRYRFESSHTADISAAVYGSFLIRNRLNCTLDPKWWF